jgi:tetratricopeptide (TPR) repeat protein
MRSSVWNILAAVLAVALLTQTTVAAEVPKAAAAALYPGETGYPSDAVRARTDELSARTLGLLLRCLSELALQQPKSALVYCDKAIQIDPTNAGGYKLRGEAYYMLGEFRTAKREFDTAIKLDADDPEAYAGRGDTLRNLLSFRAAIADYTKALALSPQDERLWHARCWARALWGRELLTALADCDRSIGFNDEFSLAFNSRGLVYLRLGMPTQALHDYDRAIDLQPRFPMALFARAVVERQLGRRVAAHRDTALALQLDPNVAKKYAAFGLFKKSAPARSKPAVCPPRGCGKITLTFAPRAVPARASLRLAAAWIAGRAPLVFRERLHENRR